MESKSLRVVYMGTPDFAVLPLKSLYEQGYHIVGVVTTPDKAAGRGLKVQESAVKKYALSVGLPILQPEKLKAPEFIEQFRALRADLGIVIAFRMLPEVIWSMPPMGTFNLHASLLPQYRGAAPINWAIINGEKQSGVTTFLLNHEIDKGDILCRSAVDILPSDNVGTLHDRLMELGSELVIETVEKIATGELTPMAQLEPEVMRPAPKIFKESCRIDWTASGKHISNLIRGLSPYPGAWSIWNDTLSGVESTLKIFSATFEADTAPIPAGSVRLAERDKLQIACSDGYLTLHEIQLPGKRRMPTTEVLRGLKNPEHFSATSPL